MKKIFLSLLILFYPIVGFSAIDERKTDMYFANGIKTSEPEAIANAVILRNAVKDETYGGNLAKYNKHIGKVDYAYNETHGLFPDGVETFLQKLGWTELNNVLNPSHQTDLSEQVKKYEDSIKSGHKVLVVAHSQGNLYTYEAYIGIAGWMQNYFEAISVASPMEADIKTGTPRIDWDNDLVARIPTLGSSDSSDINNSVRKVSWALQNNPINHSIGKPTSNYVYKSQVDDIYSNGTYEYKAVEDGVNSKVHAFTFYMGEKLNDGNTSEIIINPFTDKPLVNNDAKIEIMKAIKSKIDLLEAKPSQWQIQTENNTTSICEERRAKLAHFENAVTLEDNVFPFNTTTGKVYQVPDESGADHYVLGSAEGTKIIDVQDGTDNRCYALENTSETISVQSCSNLKVASGEITVGLMWEDRTIDLDLTLFKEEVEQGTKDLSDIKCPTEHLYLSNSEVTPGLYSVHITQKGDVNASQIPETIYLEIQAGDKARIYEITVENPDDLNIGRIADIVVDETNSPEISTVNLTGTAITVKGYTVPASHAGGGGSGSNSSYVYRIIPFINQVLAGPLSGAALELYALDAYVAGQVPLYTGTASIGTELHTAGVVKLSNDLMSQLQDDQLYLLIANGGKDIDADDDKVIDYEPTRNHGSMHGVFTGEALKQGGFKVNILTELAFQVTQEHFGLKDNVELLDEFDAIAKKLLKEDCSFDGNIDGTDLFHWLPTEHQGKLLLDYRQYIEPLVRKLLAGEDIRSDAYSLLYGVFPPTSMAGDDIVSFTGESVTLDGSSSYSGNEESYIVAYRWYEGDTLLCDSDTPICVLEDLSVGTHLIELRVEDNNGNKNSDTCIVTVVENPPVAEAGEDMTIGEGESAILDGSASYDPDGEIVEYLWSKQNTVYCQQATPQCVVDDLDFGLHLLELKVTDDKGESHTDSVTVKVQGVGRVIGTAVTSGYAMKSALSSAGNIVYVADSYSGLQIIDVNDPYQPSIIATLDTSGNAYDVALSHDDTLAYLADSESGVQIIDVSDPAAPQHVSHIETSAEANGVTISPDGTKAYVADGASGLKVLDITNAVDPKIIGGIDTPGKAWNIALSSDNMKAYVADGNGIVVVDISDPANPNIISSINITGYIWEVALSADERHLFAAADYAGLQIFNIENIEEETEAVGSAATSYKAYSITLSNDGNVAYAGDLDSRLEVIDIANPANPVNIGGILTSGGIRGIVLSHDAQNAYVTGGDLQVIDISMY